MASYTLHIHRGSSTSSYTYLPTDHQYRLSSPSSSVPWHKSRELREQCSRGYDSVSLAPRAPLSNKMHIRQNNHASSSPTSLSYQMRGSASLHTTGAVGEKTANHRPNRGLRSKAARESAQPTTRANHVSAPIHAHQPASRVSEASMHAQTPAYRASPLQTTANASRRNRHYAQAGHRRERAIPQATNRPSRPHRASPQTAPTATDTTTHAPPAPTSTHRCQNLSNPHQNRPISTASPCRSNSRNAPRAANSPRSPLSQPAHRGPNACTPAHKPSTLGRAAHLPALLAYTHRHDDAASPPCNGSPSSPYSPNLPPKTTPAHPTPNNPRRTWAAPPPQRESPRHAKNARLSPSKTTDGRYTHRPQPRRCRTHPNPNNPSPHASSATLVPFPNAPPKISYVYEAKSTPSQLTAYSLQLTTFVSRLFSLCLCIALSRKARYGLCIALSRFARYGLLATLLPLAGQYAPLVALFRYRSIRALLFCQFAQAASIIVFRTPLPRQYTML